MFSFMFNHSTHPMSDLSISALNGPQSLCPSKSPMEFCYHVFRYFWLTCITLFLDCFRSEFPLNLSLAFSSFSWVSLASCSFSFCSSFSNPSTAFWYLSNCVSQPKLYHFILSSSCLVQFMLRSCTTPFISWHSSILLSEACNVFESVSATRFQESCLCFHS